MSVALKNGCYHSGFIALHVRPHFTPYFYSFSGVSAVSTYAVIPAVHMYILLSFHCEYEEVSDNQ